MPAWVTSSRPETIEDMAFLSGAALSHLHLVLATEVPQALLRDRLALRAAEACVAFSGRPETGGRVRDAVHLLRPGDLPGPAGEIYLSWGRAVERPVVGQGVAPGLAAIAPEQIAALADPGQGAPITRPPRCWKPV